VQFKKKERLYVSDIVDTPVITYPAWYTLSAYLKENEMLHDTLRAIHNCDFEYYEVPASYDAVFAALESGRFPIYKEKYATGYFGGKVMYLESNGWKSMPVTRELFALDNWLV
jgi:hypothetical protein